MSYLVSAATIFLGWAGFGPLQTLVQIDDRIYYFLERRESHSKLAMPEVTGLKRVVFVDIDDETVSLSEAPERTPSEIIAKIVREVRAEAPAAIFIDLDLRDRNSTPGDDELMQELQRKKQPPVLLPYFFDRSMPACMSQDSVAGTRAGLMPTHFDKSASDSVFAVHGLLEQTVNDMTVGVCSVYRIRGELAGLSKDIPAAMFEALRLARHAPEPKQWELRTISPTWRIVDKRQFLRMPSGQRAYSWIPAKRLESADVDKDPLHDAIVIIGATHSSSQDRHKTVPDNEMIGALVHANVALELQVPTEEGGLWRTVFKPFLLDCLFSTTAAFLAVWICWHPFYKKLGERKHPTFSQRVLRLVSEVLLIFGMWVCLSVFVLRAGAILGDFLEIWHFAFFTTLVGVILVFLVELISLIGDTTGSFVTEHVHERLKKRKDSNR